MIGNVNQIQQTTPHDVNKAKNKKNVDGMNPHIGFIKTIPHHKY